MTFNKIAITTLAVAAAVSVRAVTLVGNGAAKCSIVLGDVGAPGAYGAAELADYLAKITGAEIVVGNETREGRLPVFFARKGPDIANWPDDAKRAANQVKDDGFSIVATPMAVYVYARESRGHVYAAYEILKRWGDCRWFFPGPEGECVPKTATFEIPNGTVVSNPTFRKRFFNFVCYNRGKAAEAFKWQLRNNMIVIGHPGYPDFDRFGMFYEVGGHVFSTLLPDKLFNDHPEYFCMVRGRRLPQSGKVDANGKYVSGSAQANQPCLSNPETRRIMKENLLKLLLKKPIPDLLQIINNDSRQWCECASCAAMDPPGEKFRGGRATRYWTLVNELLSHARQYLPGLDVQVLGYQDFQAPPGDDSPIRPNQNATVPLAVHQRCYAHSMGDESCRVNARFRKTFEAWKKAGVKLATYEYSNMMPGGVHRYNPLERIVAEDLKYYASLGLESYIDEVPPYLAEYNMKRWGVGTTVAMRANWLVHYVQAQFLWNAKSDYAAVVEDAGSKFYGKAWPAMKIYKAKLEELFFGAGIHFMYGTSGRALGKLFADAVVEKQVYALLDQAAAAAKGDAVLEAKIAMEREWLKGSWSYCAEDYRQRACKTFTIPKSSPLVDGDPSGASWASIPVAAKNFKKRSDIVPAKHQTEVKFAWDENDLYFGITCLDDRAAEVSSQHVERDSLVWEDNDIEIFIAPENLGGAELHLAINAKGAVYDTLALGQGGNADLAFDAKAVVKTRVLSDRWTATVAVPFASFGVEPKPGAKIPVNVGRFRQLLDPNEKIEVSSWNSFFHGPEVFNSIELSVPSDVARVVKERIDLIEGSDLSAHWKVFLKKTGNADPLGVFTAENGVIKVNGLDYGSVTTKNAYKDYRFSLEYRFVGDGELNRKGKARDGGLLFHASGDMIVVGKSGAKDTGVYSCKSKVCRDGAAEGPWGNRRRYDPEGTEIELKEWTRLRRCDVDINWKDVGTQAVSPNENPIGEWNKVELVCDGDTAKHYFNGKLVNEFWDIKPSSGYIQLQSEAQGIEYRNIILEPLNVTGKSGK